METYKKNLLVIWLAQFFTMAGLSSIIPFLPLFIRELGVTELQATAQWSGLVFAGPFLIAFFVAPLWGSLGDKFGRKLMVLRAVFGLSIAQMLVSFAADPTQLFIFRLIQGGLSGFYPAAIALIASNTPTSKTGQSLGMVQSASAAGNIIGPVIGGVLAEIFGFRDVFRIVSVVIFLSGLLVLFFVKEETKPDANAKRYTLIDNWKHTLTTKNLRTAVFLIAGTGIGFNIARPLFVLYIETFSIKGISLPLVTGAVYSLLGIFATISAMVFGRKIKGSTIKKGLLIAFSLSGFMYIVHSLVGNIFMLIPARILLGLSFGVLHPILYSWISFNTTNERKGSILGVGSSFQILGILIGSLASGGLVSVWGLREAFFVAGILYLVFALFAFNQVEGKKQE